MSINNNQARLAYRARTRYYWIGRFVDLSTELQGPGHWIRPCTSFLDETSATTDDCVGASMTSTAFRRSASFPSLLRVKRRSTDTQLTCSPARMLFISTSCASQRKAHCYFVLVAPSVRSSISQFDAENTRLQWASITGRQLAYVRELPIVYGWKTRTADPVELLNRHSLRKRLPES
jgi:hypothetical protein